MSVICSGNCSSLIDASNIQFEDHNYILNYEGAFYNNINLTVLPEFKFTNFQRLNLNYMLYNCQNLTNFPENFKIPTESCINSQLMCFNNYSLTEIPSRII